MNDPNLNLFNTKPYTLLKLVSRIECSSLVSRRVVSFELFDIDWTKSKSLSMFSFEGPSTASEYLAPFWSVNWIFTFGGVHFGGNLPGGKSSIMLDMVQWLDIGLEYCCISYKAVNK